MDQIPSLQPNKNMPKLDGQAEEYVQKLKACISNLMMHVDKLNSWQNTNCKVKEEEGSAVNPKLYPLIMAYSSNEYLYVNFGSITNLQLPSISNPLELMQLCATHHQRNMSLINRQIMNKYRDTVEYQEVEQIIRSRLSIPSTGKPTKQQSYETRLQQFNECERRDFKNMPKNYTKAIIIFILAKQELIARVLPSSLIPEFIEFLNVQKNTVFNLKHLQSMVDDRVADPKQRQFNKAFRILGAHFLRTNSVEYIFNSKIVHINWHLKYKRKFIHGFQNPQELQVFKRVP